MESLWLIAAGISLVASVFFSIAESGLLYYSRARLEQRVKGEKLARVDRRLANKNRLLLAAVSLNMLFNVLFVTFITLAVIYPGGISFGSVMASIGWSILGVLIIGEIIPRALARHTAERALVATLPLVSFTASVLKYPLSAMELIGTMIGRLLGVGPEDEEDELEEQILQAVSESRKEGEMLEHEKEMLESIFDFREAEVSEIMTPRTDMQCIEATASIEDALNFALEKGLSRLPVFEENRDNIIGLLYVKDLLKLWGQDTSKISLREVLRKPMYVPEKKKVWNLLHEMQLQRMHMAIVLDEYGGTAGLVTVEDIIEEIVGDIRDEYDRVAEVMLRQVDKQTVEVDARVHVEDVNEALDLDLPEDEEYETVGGFILSKMGKVPSAGETYRSDSVEFTILDADDRHIKSIRIARTPEASEQQAQ